MGTTRSYACVTQAGLTRLGSNVMRTSRVLLPRCARRATLVSLLPWCRVLQGLSALQGCPKKPIPIAGAQLCSWNTRRELYQKVGNFVGSVLSPLLANLFLHYAFDRWMQKTYPHLPFERYADDAIVHCRTETEAQEVRQAIAERMQACRLELHPEKTKIVYCKDDDRRGTYPHEQFDFLGYTFRPRRSKNWKGKFFINFSPAIADKAGKEIRAEMRSWQLHLRSDKSLEDLSRMFNPKVRGWLQYYGRYYRVCPTFYTWRFEQGCAAHDASRDPCTLRCTA